MILITGRACVFRTWPCLRTPCSFQKIYRYTIRETNAVRKPGQGNYKVHCKPLCAPLVLLRTWSKWWKTTRRDRATDWVDWGPEDHCGQAPHLQMRKLEQWRWILKSGCLISIISQANDINSISISIIISGKWVCLSEFSFRVYKTGTCEYLPYSASYLPVPQLNERSTDCSYYLWSSGLREQAWESSNLGSTPSWATEWLSEWL